MKCPNCGSENVNLIHNTSKRGFNGSDACCGYILMGPLGILCGALGSGKKETSEFWLCNNCGSRFKDKDIVKYNQNNQPNSYIYNQPIEEAYIEPEEIEEVQKPALPEIPVYNEDLCAPKTVFNKTEPYSGGLGVESLLKRAALFLEDNEWEKAYEYSENAIDIDACCAEAYLFKFMAEYNIPAEDSIPVECAYMIKQIASLTELENYKKAYRFGNDEMKLKLEKYSNQAVYNYADKLAVNAHSKEEYINAAEIFVRISDYSDSAERAKKLYEKNRSDKYSNALKIMNSAVSASEMDRAKVAFEELGNYKDSKQMAKKCGEKYQDLEYNYACKMLDKAINDSDIDYAKAAFKKLGDYKDSKRKAEDCDEKKLELKYNAACQMLDTAQDVSDIRHVQFLLEELGDYRDAAEKAASCNKKCSDFYYNEACEFLENAKTVHNIDDAVELFNRVQGYDDINDRLEECETKRGEIIDINKKRLKIGLICCVGVLIMIIIIINIAASAVNRNDKESAENVPDIVSETESEITTVSVTDETKKIISNEISVSEDDDQRLENVSSEEKTFIFNGGSIECVEYKYYALDEYEITTEYINFSAKVKLDNYPYSESAINYALAEIGNMPTAEVLRDSKAPDSIDMGMISEHNQISSVYAENNLLFVTTDYLYDGGGGVSASLFSKSTNYIFDFKTGKQLKIEQLFKDFDIIKQIAVEYADKYVKENIDYDSYHFKEYNMEKLYDSEWYNEGRWEYNKDSFTVHFEGWLIYTSGILSLRYIPIEIPADVIRPYFASENERAGSGGKTKLADIVGPGLSPSAPAPNIEVNVTLADISQTDYRILIHDLEHCVDMYKSIYGCNESSFCDDRRLLGTDDSYGDIIYYYATDYNNADELFNDARNCFSESFVSTDVLIAKMFEGDFPAFVSIDGRVAWSFWPPNPSGKYDFDNAGVVMYSDTEAEVWVADCDLIGEDFNVEVFKMIRHDTNDNWKIDSVKRPKYAYYAEWTDYADYADFDNMQEIDFDSV